MIPLPLTARGRVVAFLIAAALLAAVGAAIASEPGECYEATVNQLPCHVCSHDRGRVLAMDCGDVAAPVRP